MIATTDHTHAFVAEAVSQGLPVRQKAAPYTAVYHCDSTYQYMSVAKDYIDIRPATTVAAICLEPQDTSAAGKVDQRVVACQMLTNKRLSLKLS